MKLIPKVAKTVLFASAAIAIETIFAPLASQAATLAFSESRATVTNFSQPIRNTATDTDTDAIVVEISPDASVLAESSAEADATIQPTSQLTSLAISAVSGNGAEYIGTAFANSLTAGRFQIQADGIWAFDFVVGIALQTLIDQPETESAIASNEVLFRLIDNQTGNVLDEFGLLGQSLNNSQPQFTFQPGLQQFEANLTDSLLSDGATVVLWQGRYTRTVATGDDLTLETFKFSETRASAVPAPPVVGGAVVGIVFWLQQRQQRSRRNH